MFAQRDCLRAGLTARRAVKDSSSDSLGRFFSSSCLLLHGLTVAASVPGIPSIFQTGRRGKGWQQAFLLVCPFYQKSKNVSWEPSSILCFLGPSWYRFTPHSKKGEEFYAEKEYGRVCIEFIHLSSLPESGHTAAPHHQPASASGPNRCCRRRLATVKGTLGCFPLAVLMVAVVRTSALLDAHRSSSCEDSEVRMVLITDDKYGVSGTDITWYDTLQ